MIRSSTECSVPQLMRNLLSRGLPYNERFSEPGSKGLFALQWVSVRHRVQMFENLANLRHVDWKGASETETIEQEKRWRNKGERQR